VPGEASVAVTEEARVVRLIKADAGLGMKIVSLEGVSFPIVKEVMEGGAAKKAGVRPFDVILEVRCARPPALALGCL
jgi:C-terminal processing protease CtpA/Prc